ncbi:unnamed protein product [Rhizoctonia solani]|uniref:Protein kinase domain-containing protein n=1 Tax=Rhizoctonia solani TaxID=456999 RepID=A0A8H3CJY6_9AGAM|nr:unnamed protein product [Rhizoctonia solani]
MKYEDFVSLLTTGRFTEEEAPEYCEDANEGELLSHTRRFLTEACGIKDLTNQITSDGIFLKPFARGGFTDIYRSALNNGNQVAIKLRRRRSSGSPYFEYRETIKDAYNWSQIRHRNINELLGFTIFLNAIGLVSYYASNGTIPQYIHNRPSTDRMNLCIQISQGVSYMHSIGMVHGDIKGANVVVMEDGAAKLIDFETCVFERSPWNFEPRDHATLFSARWTAPELIGEGRERTRAFDVYGLAMTILEIASGKIPWSKYSREALVVMATVRGENPDRPSQILDINGDSLWELLLDCWKTEPAERPGAGSVLRLLKALPPNCLGPLETQSKSETTPAPIPSPVHIIRRCMSVQEIASCLIKHGCLDISKTIDEQTFDEVPSFTGGNSDIYHGQLLDSSEVCIKVPRRSWKRSEEAEDRVYTSREIHTWSRCNHPNIVPFLGLIVFRGEIGAVSPYLRNGTLRTFLEQNPGRDRCDLSTQICEGLAYLHSIDLMMSQNNVFISDSGNALIADFGSADISNRGMDFTLFMNRCGYTTRWAARELLKYGILRCKEADVYALGMTILETFTGEVPFKGKRRDHIVKMAILGGEFPNRPLAQIPVNSTHGNQLWKLLCDCWSSKLEERPNADKVLEGVKTITMGGLAPAVQV